MAWAQRDDSTDREFFSGSARIPRVLHLRSCDGCMEPITGDIVLMTDRVYCSVDCALEDFGDYNSERVPGLYLG